jgi:pentose-5-phosphate-3-epimerase
MEIIPAILTNDPSELKKLLGMAEGKAKRVQIDIIDGEFVDNKTVEPLVLENIETNLDLDFHLMVGEPVTGESVFGLMLIG